jgi:hypothetical protein
MQMLLLLLLLQVLLPAAAVQTYWDQPADQPSTIASTPLPQGSRISRHAKLSLLRP